MSDMFSQVNSYTSGLYGGMLYNVNQTGYVTDKNADPVTKMSQDAYKEDEIQDTAQISQAAQDKLKSEKANTESSHTGEQKSQDKPEDETKKKP
ncbi:MAG: hypothetical protein PHV37_07310 [Candidatus Gastranaerophilales bacterium]|nr:hypothetical protein [Candidatus Gastranaerophilales bacterium]